MPIYTAHNIASTFATILTLFCYTHKIWQLHQPSPDIELSTNLFKWAFRLDPFPTAENPVVSEAKIHDGRAS